jgi:hypothetical protein
VGGEGEVCLRRALSFESFRKRAEAGVMTGRRHTTLHTAAGTTCTRAHTSIPLSTKNNCELQTATDGSNANAGNGVVRLGRIWILSILVFSACGLLGSKFCATHLSAVVRTLPRGGGRGRAAVLYLMPRISMPCRAMICTVQHSTNSAAQKANSPPTICPSKSLTLVKRLSALGSHSAALPFAVSAC